MNLKLNLKLHLASQNMTASDLSRISRVPKTTISDWLAGRSPKNLNHLKTVANIFKVNIDDLIFGDFNEMKKKSDEPLIESSLVPLGQFDVYMKRIK